MLWYVITSTPPLSAVSVSYTQTDTSLTFTATATGGSNVQYQFWVYYPNANPAWQQLQAYSPQATCTWTPTMDGPFVISVTARDGSPAWK